jgi:23S rRNA pseudouridine1911/1915/1917 synthase
MRMPLDRREFRVESQSELLPYLLGLPLGLSRKQTKDLLRFHAVRVRNRATLRHDTQLRPGDLVIVALGNRPADTKLTLHGIRIVYIDDSIVVIDKPPGLLSMGSIREKEKTAHRILNDYLKALTNSLRQQAFIVHRLDRDTSGLMIFARSEATQAALQAGWKHVTKKYMAVVQGIPLCASGTLRDNLIEGKSLMVHRVVRGGELAVTHYRVIRRNGERSLLELTLETGRKHQIRVQLAIRGHFIIGDRKYGPHTTPTRRLALHSFELRFRHPVSAVPIEFNSPLPVSLNELLEPHAPLRSS